MEHKGQQVGLGVKKKLEFVNTNVMIDMKLLVVPQSKR
jgi:hypothetical protein